MYRSIPIASGGRVTLPTIDTRADFTWPILVLLCFALRFFYPATVLNDIVPYTLNTGGSLYKLHPGTYGILTMCLISTRRRSPPVEAGVARGMTMIAGGVLVCAIHGLLRGSDALGYLIDSFLCGLGATYLSATLTARGRLLVTMGILLLMSANAALCIAEFLTKVHVVSGAYRGRDFRSWGMLDHPLLVGLMSVTTIPLLAAVSRVRSFSAVMGVLLLVGATLAAGARVASLVSAGVGSFALIFIFRRALETARTPSAKNLIFFNGLAAIGVAISGAVLLVFSPLAYRFAGQFIDESARTRLDVYSLLNYLQPSEFWFGSTNRRLALLNKMMFSNENVESPIVMAIFQYGAIVATVLFASFSTGIIQIARSYGRDALLAAGAFLLIASSNNTFMVKTPAIVFALAILPLFRSQQQGTGQF